MKPIAFIVSRLIKIFANITKQLCYVFHFLFPKARFTLPRQAGPLIKLGGRRAVPKILWQTNFIGRVTLPVYLNYLFNRLMSPTFEYRFMITEERAEFIQANYPDDIFEAYSRLQIGAAQADFWRLLVVQKCGGVYMDVNANLVWPLGWLIKRDDPELYIALKDGEISNYFFASQPNNPNLAVMIDAVMQNIRNNTLTNVYDLTGPGVFNKVLAEKTVKRSNYRYTCHKGNFTNEYFQYIDKPQGKWTREQAKVDIVRK